MADLVNSIVGKFRDMTGSRQPIAVDAEVNDEASTDGIDLDDVLATAKKFKHPLLR